MTGGPGGLQLGPSCPWASGCASASSPAGPLLCELLLPGGPESVRKVPWDVSGIARVFSRSPRGAFPGQVERICLAVCQPGHSSVDLRKVLTCYYLITKCSLEL